MPIITGHFTYRGPEHPFPPEPSFAEQLASAPTPMDNASSDPSPHLNPASTLTSSTTTSASKSDPAPTPPMISSDPSIPPDFLVRRRQPHGSPLARLRRFDPGSSEPAELPAPPFYFNVVPPPLHTILTLAWPGRSSQMTVLVPTIWHASTPLAPVFRFRFHYTTLLFPLQAVM